MIAITTLEKHSEESIFNMKTIFSYILVSIVGIFMPIKPIILTIISLVLIDFFFAIYRAYKSKKVISSRKMYATLPKLLMYNVVIIMIYYSNIHIFNTGIPLEKIIASFIALIEIKSIDENFKYIMGFSIWSKLMKTLDRGENLHKQQ
ncbi:Bacteriophage holin family [uncultured Caudovirales phage]|uniref:Bacteriophage holin family n=1 Tax=uncultured Caudovirales phage TaxID=2100421 RepID=A0A6J5NH42_9CAUD|nr:Bacteriophage holin family [uncultured Caudovirales phage]